MNTTTKEVIQTNSRQEAFVNGDLIDVTVAAKQYGQMYSTAVTKSVYDYMIRNVEPTNEQQVNLKTKHVCETMTNAIRTYLPQTPELVFPITRRTNDFQEEVELKVKVEQGNAPEPFLTISLPDED